jgi:hypothetical protein
MSRWTRLDWTRLDWTRLDLARMDSTKYRTGLDSNGMHSTTPARLAGERTNKQTGRQTRWKS